MTINEFLEIYKKEVEKDPCGGLNYVGFNQAIRFCKPNDSYAYDCPITFVCRKTLGQNHPNRYYIEAADQLGLISADAMTIANAADSCHLDEYLVRKIREKLLEPLKTQERR